MLVQRDDHGDPHPVEFYGRTLTSPETRYSVTELELLAVVTAFKHWKHYLHSLSGDPVLLRTDHASLLYLSVAKDLEKGGPASRLTRWYLYLQTFNIEVRHKPGAIHHDADLLSRLQGHPEYEKLKVSPAHVKWLKVHSSDGEGAAARMGGDVSTPNGDPTTNFCNTQPAVTTPTHSHTATTEAAPTTVEPTILPSQVSTEGTVDRLSESPPDRQPPVKCDARTETCTEGTPPAEAAIPGPSHSNQNGGKCQASHSATAAVVRSSNPTASRHSETARSERPPETRARPQPAAVQEPARVAVTSPAASRKTGPSATGSRRTRSGGQPPSPEAGAPHESVAARAAKPPQSLCKAPEVRKDKQAKPPGIAGRRLTITEQNLMQDVFGVKPLLTTDCIRITTIQALSHAAPRNVTILSSSVLDTPAQVLAHLCADDSKRPWGLAKRIYELYPEARPPRDPEKTELDKATTAGCSRGS